MILYLEEEEYEVSRVLLVQYIRTTSSDPSISSSPNLLLLFLFVPQSNKNKKISKKKRLKNNKHFFHRKDRSYLGRRNFFKSIERKIREKETNMHHLKFRCQSVQFKPFFAILYCKIDRAVFFFLYKLIFNQLCLSMIDRS